MFLKKTQKMISWFLLLSFFFSLEGVNVVLAQTPEILDSPGTQAGDAKTPAAAPEPATGIVSSNASPYPYSGSTGTQYKPNDEVGKESLAIPPNPSELVLVENYENYNIPPAEGTADEGRTGPCGPYATTSAMKGRGSKISYAEVLKVLKPQDMYTTPNEIVDYLLSQQFSVRRVDNFGLDGILKFIKEEKKSVICIVDACNVERVDGQIKATKTFLQHWVNVVGMRVVNGEIKSVLTKDTYFANDSGSVMEMPADEFDFRWKEMRGPYSLAINTHRCAILAGGPGSVGFMDRLARYANVTDPGELAAEGVATGYKSAMETWDGLKTLFTSGDPTKLVNGLVGVGTALTKVASALVAYPVFKIGEGLDAAGGWVSKQAANLWGNGGVLGKIAAVPLAIIGGALQLVGGALKVAATVFTTVVSAITTVVKDVVKGVTDFLKGLAEKLNPFNWF